MEDFKKKKPTDALKIAAVCAVVLSGLVTGYTCTKSTGGRTELQRSVDEITLQAFKAGFVVGVHHRGKKPLNETEMEAILDSIADSLSITREYAEARPPFKIRNKKADR